jgi:hypothetical protein
MNDQKVQILIERYAGNKEEQTNILNDLSLQNRQLRKSMRKHKKLGNTKIVETLDNQIYENMDLQSRLQWGWVYLEAEIK